MRCPKENSADLNKMEEYFALAESNFRTGTIKGSVAIYRKFPMGLSSPIKIHEYTARSIKRIYSRPSTIFTVDTSK